MMTMNSEKSCDIAYEQIVDAFWHGVYGEFRVIMMNDCGFINATKLCHDGGKELHHWHENQSSKELLECLAKKFNVEIQSPLIRKVVRTLNETDNGKIISGTYYNPLIIPHIACWISPEFAIRVGGIVNDYLVLNYKRCFEEERLARQSAEKFLDAKISDHIV